MRTLKFLIVALVAWFLVVMGISIVADAVGIPDTTTWAWVIRFIGLAMAICVAWAVVGSTKATDVLMTALHGIGFVTNLMYIFCFFLGAVAVVMMFVKDAEWVGDKVFHPFVLPIGALCISSLFPLSLFLMCFRKTRALGGIILYFLSLFLGFELWFLCLIVVAYHGLGWMIAGLLGFGLGVVPIAILLAAFGREWATAGALLLTTVLIFVGRSVGLWIAIKRAEKDELEESAPTTHEVQVTAIESEPVEPTEDEPV